jgi:hypothetical protein
MVPIWVWIGTVNDNPSYTIATGYDTDKVLECVITNLVNDSTCNYDPETDTMETVELFGPFALVRVDENGDLVPTEFQPENPRSYEAIDTHTVIDETNFNSLGL